MTEAQAFGERDARTDFDEFLEEALAGEYVGKCRECGYVQYGVEPDAQNYECEDCGKLAVDGAMYVLM